MTAESGVPPQEVVIAVDRVTKRFGDFVAVDDVSIAVPRGEFCSLLGPSGCGKTTTLRMIAGFERPTRGRVLLEGRDVSDVAPYRRNVNTVFQHYALFPHMSVRDNVAFGPRSQRIGAKEVDRRVTALLDVVRLGPLADRRPAQLSGGQQQRVALARALANRPSALLLDEPLGALDLKLRQAMQLELKRIQREVGITFIYVTHDQEEALTMSDRIAVMNRGRIEQVGTPEQIYDSPSTVFVAGFIGVANLIPARVSDLGHGELEVRIAGDHIVPVHYEAGGPPADHRTTLMVRPERVRLSRLPIEHGASIAVTVESAIFQGPIVRVGLRTGDGTRIVAHVGAGRATDDLRPGTTAFAGWDREASRLLVSDAAADPRDDGLGGDTGPAAAQTHGVEEPVS